MSEYTTEQVEEMVREAVEKTERSFGGTFKRLKSENEDLAKKYETAEAEKETVRHELSEKVSSLESSLEDSRRRISELAVRGELERQLREKGPLPERFVDVDRIEYSDDPETLSASVADVIEEGKKNLETALHNMGIDPVYTGRAAANPTNPPSRDTTTAQDLKHEATKHVLRDMMNRGLLR